MEFVMSYVFDAQTTVFRTPRQIRKSAPFPSELCRVKSGEHFNWEIHPWKGLHKIKIFLKTYHPLVPLGLFAFCSTYFSTIYVRIAPTQWILLLMLVLICHLGCHLGMLTTEKSIF